MTASPKISPPPNAYTLLSDIIFVYFQLCYISRSALLVAICPFQITLHASDVVHYGVTSWFCLRGWSYLPHHSIPMYHVSCAVVSSILHTRKLRLGHKAHKDSRMLSIIWEISHFSLPLSTGMLFWSSVSLRELGNLWLTLKLCDRWSSVFTLLLAQERSDLAGLILLMPGLGKRSLPPHLASSTHTQCPFQGWGYDLDNAFNHSVHFQLPLPDECTLTAISLFVILFPCNITLISACASHTYFQSFYLFIGLTRVRLELP